MAYKLKQYEDSPHHSRHLRTMSWTGLALLLVISALSFWSSHRYQKSTEWRDHSEAVLEHSRLVEMGLHAAEARQRGYVITGQDVFAEKFRELREPTEAGLQKLLHMTKDNPEQQKIIQDLIPLVEDKFLFLEKVVRLVELKRASEAIREIKNGHGRVVMEQIEEAFDNFIEAEVSLLKSRTVAADRNFRMVSFLVVGGLLLAFLLLLWVMVLLQQEIKQRRAVEQELVFAEAKASEASDLKSSFLANMSHEIRTPLNGIVGMAKLLESTRLTAEQRDFLDTMKVSSNSLLTLINQILDFSKIESGKMQLEEAPFELNSLIQSTVAIVDYAATTKNIRLHVVVGPDVPEFFLGDALRLRQVILNLLNNAIKFSERGTIKIQVSVKKVWDSRATLTFEVIDEGMGLDEETKSRLFKTFSQGDQSTSRRFGGSGLGLAISKQIVEMMGGHIGVESVLGEGSRFFFDVTLKVSKFRADLPQEETIEMKPRNLGAHLLVAEDNKVNQKVVAEMTRMLGCTVTLVNNGQAVLDSLRKEKFDLILMDGQMPGMDGYEASRRIRLGEAGHDCRRIPIVATTANAIKGDIEKCLESGMNDYIGKPISYDDLAYKVEKWLQRGSRLIDRDAIDQLISLEKSSGTDLLSGLIELFETESKNSLKTMREKLSESNFEAVYKLAHSLKSASANLGALRLRDLCERIEKSKVDPHPEHVKMLLDSATEEYAAALEELKSGWLRR